MNPNISSTEIREILAKRIDQQKQAVGIVVGIIEPTGRRIIAHGNMAAGDPRTLDADTIFEIGSVTKVFTSIVLADMVNRSEVALDDPAAKYLPVNVTMPERSGKSITLHDLSTHSSGLPRIPTNLKPKDPRNPYADYTAEDLYQFLSSYTLPRDPGSELEYSNLGAGLLGHLLASSAGTDFETLIRTHITQPLHMPDTAIQLSSSMQQRMATGHNFNLEPAANWDLPSLAGAGALRSSANDMLTLLEAFLGYNDSPLAPAMKATQEVRRPLGKANLGLAWFLFPMDGMEIAMHDGGTGGFCSFVGFDPKAGVGVVVLCNTFTPAVVADIGLHILNPKVPLANPEPPPTPIPIDPKLLNNYTGRYQLPDRVLEIIRDGDRLFAQATGQVNGQPIVGPRFEMFAESEKSFFVKMTGSKIAFETDPDGRAASLTMQRSGREPASAPRLP
jgi:serine-type D-Ala-D-Ala carboxypeptidase/endopeptidase